MHRTPAEAKQWLFDQGYTIKGWARAHNYSYVSVQKVLNDEHKMLYGEGREIGKKLNIKVPE